MCPYPRGIRPLTGGEGGIRTHGTVTPTTVFETALANGTALKDRMIKVQTTLVAGPGFGPIFAIVARNGAAFGIGGFESPQPPNILISNINFQCREAYYRPRRPWVATGSPPGPQHGAPDGFRPLTPETGVRNPYGAPYFSASEQTSPTFPQ